MASAEVTEDEQRSGGEERAAEPDGRRRRALELEGPDVERCRGAPPQQRRAVTRDRHEDQHRRPDEDIHALFQSKPVDGRNDRSRAASRTLATPPPTRTIACASSEQRGER